MTRDEGKSVFVVSAIAGGVLLGVSLGFVLLYPRLFPNVDAAWPGNFEETVHTCLENGDTAKALRIARHVCDIAANNRKAHALQGDILLASGNAEEAVRQYERAVSFTHNPAPDYRKTDMAFYYAPARIPLGKLALADGDSLAAVRHFEFARPYVDLSAGEYAEYRPMLHDAYAQWGQWARAFDLGEPSTAPLAGMDSGVQSRFALACEGAGRWDLAEWAAGLLAKVPEYKGQAAYLLGRARFARHEFEDAIPHLAESAETGHLDAPFFLGLSLEESGSAVGAHRAHLRTPAESLYRAFALARAANLQSSGAVNVPASDAGRVMDELNTEMTGPRRIRNAQVSDKFLRLRPVGVDFSQAHFEAGGPFLMLTSWLERQAQASQSKGFGLRLNEDGTGCLQNGPRILQLQWARNEWAFSGLERLPEGDIELPGWRKRDGAWGEGDKSQVATADGEGPHLVISKAKPEGNTLLESAPVKVEPNVAYLVAVRTKATDATSLCLISAFDDEEHGVFGMTLRRKAQPDWGWLAGYAEVPAFSKTLSVRLGAGEAAGQIACDDMMLVRLIEPVLSSPNG